MNIRITYCGMWNYKPQASRLEEEIKAVYRDAKIETIESSGGVFEVEVNEKLIFSKLRLERFPEDGEILKEIECSDLWCF